MGCTTRHPLALERPSGRRPLPTGCHVGNTLRMCAKASTISLTAVVGVSLAFAACSAVSQRTAARDRAIGIHGSEDWERGPQLRASQPGAPSQSRLELARGMHRGQRVAELAMKLRGVPYQWGSAGPDGFDCSGLVKHVYAQVGVRLPHNAALQYQYGTAVSRHSLEPGDLVFFDDLRHNGIYIGHGRFVHAGRTGKRVGVATLDEDWYRSRWAGARRL
jgi:cell wall-associated NlpC family hydrolase